MAIDDPTLASVGATSTPARSSAAYDAGLSYHETGTHSSQAILIVVMGVAGTGKSTLATALNAALGLPYVEGDDLHPKTNIEKMSQGIPLNDQDRVPWLQHIRTIAETTVAEQLGAASQAPITSEHSDLPVSGFTSPSPSQERVVSKIKGVMVTCSALKRYYRDILRGTQGLRADIASSSEPTRPSSTPFPTLPTYFVYIKEEQGLLRERIANRQGHFMKAGMVDSQLAALESPEGEEGVVVVPLNATTGEQVKVALEGLERLIGPL